MIPTPIDRWNAMPYEEKLRSFDQFHMISWWKAVYGLEDGRDAVYHNGIDFLWP